MQLTWPYGAEAEEITLSRDIAKGRPSLTRGLLTATSRDWFHRGFSDMPMPITCDL